MWQDVQSWPVLPGVQGLCVSGLMTGAGGSVPPAWQRMQSRLPGIRRLLECGSWQSPQRTPA